jgi:hypothetical protein
MANFAVIDENIVVNVIVADNKEIAETVTGFTCVESDLAAIGYTWDGENFSAPVVEPIVEPVVELTE